MKGSTLHRSGLTREKMGVLASLTQSDNKKQNAKSQLNQYHRVSKNQELDILWGGVQRGIQKVHNATKSPHSKSPAVYLSIGFIAGVLFMSCIILIVSINSLNPKTTVVQEPKSDVAIISDDNPATVEEPVATQLTELLIVSMEDIMKLKFWKF